ncbi:hypothetical protein [Helicobacter pametensis]|uniref:hypothetical protein n=1 Tax=Helicobacter pametensis TaxID=95149 RepID=UPI000480AB71|nr:hypothetical protein [Helicobacter pametensis]
MKKILWFLFSGLIPLSSIGIALYIFDPYQLFHKPILRKPIFNADMYYQAAGIINNYAFDSVILGSSILVNTSSNEASSKIGYQWVNLSAGGASVEIRTDILRYVLKNKKIRNIIFSLEPGWLSNKNTSTNKYAYLYDQNRLNDFKTYIDEYFIACLFIHKLCLKGQNTLDRPANWINETSTKMRLGGFQSWLKNADRPDLNSVIKQIMSFKQTEYSKTLQEIYPPLIQILKHHQDTKFIFIIPPFSRLSYKIKFISIEPAIKKLLALDLKNVFIFGFDTTSIPDDLSHYVDTAHYDETINSFMLDAIKNNTHRITLKNVDSYFQEMRKKVEAYDLEPLKQQIIKSGVLNK